MKLHLPNRLRAALFACLAVTAPIATTLATGTIAGGALVASLTASSFAWASTTEPDTSGTAVSLKGNNDVTISQNEDGTYSILYATGPDTTGVSDNVAAKEDGSLAVNASLADMGDDLSLRLTVTSGTYSQLSFARVEQGSDQTFGSAENPKDLYLSVTGTAAVTAFSPGQQGLFGWTNSSSKKLYANLYVNIDTTGPDGASGADDSTTPTVAGLILTGETNTSASADGIGSMTLYGNISVTVGDGIFGTIGGTESPVSLAAGNKGTAVIGNVTYTLGANSGQPVFLGDIVGGIAQAQGGNSTGSMTGDVVINLRGGTYNGSIYATGPRAPLNGNYTVNYYGGSFGEGARIAVSQGGAFNGVATLNVGASLDSSHVLISAFDAVNVISGGELTLSGNLGIQDLSRLDNNGTISFAPGTTVAYDKNALTNVIDEDAGTVTSTGVVIGSSGKTGQYGGLDNLGAGFSSSDGQLIYTATANINGWDANWGAPTLLTSPEVAALPAISDSSISSSKETISGLGYYVLGTLSESQVKIGQDSTVDNAILVGGVKDGAFGSSGAPRNSWIYYNASGTNLKTLVGGSISMTAGSPVNFTGDSHILMASGVVENIIGGNIHTVSTTNFEGGSYVSVQSGAQVKGFIVGAGTTGENGNNESVFNGNTNVNIYSILSTNESAWLDPHSNFLTQDNGAVVGGGATGCNAGSLTVNGSTNVLVDLTGTTILNGATFNKSIVGGSLSKNRTVVQTGQSNVIIRGVDSTGANVTFTKDVIGGSSMIATGGFPTVSIQGSSVSIHGGHFADTAAVIAGVSTGYWITTNVSGCASMQITDGVFDGLVIGAARIVGSSNGSSSLTCTAKGDASFMSLEGGTFNGDVIGGIYTDKDASDKVYNLNGNVLINLGKASGTGSAGPVLNGDLYGGSYVPSGGVRTNQQDITINVYAGTTLNGNIYAGGKVSSPGHNGAAYIMSTQNVEVNIASGVTLGGTEQAPIVLSGGYKDSNDASSVQSSVLGTIGTGEVNLSDPSVTLQDFTVANVADAGSILNIGSKLKDSGITEKTGAGTLIISGANDNTTLAVNAGTLQTDAGTRLTNLTFGDNTTLKLTSSGDTALALDSLTFGSGFAIDVSNLGITGVGEHVLAQVATLGNPVDAIQVTELGLDDTQYGWTLEYDGSSLVLGVQSLAPAKDLYWIGGTGTAGIWSANDTDSFAGDAAGATGPATFVNGDNVTFATAAQPTLRDSIRVGTLTVQGAVSLNVDADTTASLTVTTLALGDSGSLAKTGAGTLTVSENLVSNATTAFALQEGTLAISGKLDGAKTFNIRSSADTTLSLAFSDNADNNTLAFTTVAAVAGTTAITDGYVSMDKVANLDVAEGATVNLTGYKNDTAMNLTGSGTVAITVTDEQEQASNKDKANNITYVAPDAENGIAGWTGTVVLSGSGKNFTFSGNASFGTENSTIEFKGLKGYVASDASAIASSVVLTNPGTSSNNYAWWWDDSYSGGKVQFSGKVSGEGTLCVSLGADVRNAGSYVLFDGNVEGFTGKVFMAPGKNPALYTQNKKEKALSQQMVDF